MNRLSFLKNLAVAIVAPNVLTNIAIEKRAGGVLTKNDKGKIVEYAVYNIPEMGKIIDMASIREFVKENNNTDLQKAYHLVRVHDLPNMSYLELKQWLKNNYDKA